MRRFTSSTSSFVFLVTSAFMVARKLAPAEVSFGAAAAAVAGLMNPFFVFLIVSTAAFARCDPSRFLRWPTRQSRRALRAMINERSGSCVSWAAGSSKGVGGVDDADGLPCTFVGRRRFARPEEGGEWRRHLYLR